MAMCGTPVLIQFLVILRQQPIDTNNQVAHKGPPFFQSRKCLVVYSIYQALNCF